MRYARASFTITGLLIFSGAFISHIQAKEIINWERTVGILEYAYTQNISTPTVGGASDWGPDKLIVRYKYWFEEKLHTGNRFMMLDFIFFPKEDFLALKKGEVVVFFNPENPNQSLLSVDYPTTAICMLVLHGSILIAVGLMLPAIANRFIRAIQVFR